MAKLLVNVRQKGRGFAGNSLRKIANKLCKTANRRTATNHSKVITRKIRSSVITLEVKKTGGGSGETEKKDQKEDTGARGTCHVVKLYEFPRTKSSYSPREYNFKMSSARNSIIFPTMLTFTFLSALSFTETLRSLFPIPSTLKR